MTSRDDIALRESGYVGRAQELGYGLAAPLYDLIVGFMLLPVGGPGAWRRQVTGWLDARESQQVLSLGCGTGAAERAILRAAPSAHVTAIDLGAGQIAMAKRRDPERRIDYRVGNAAATGLESGRFDRVLIGGALHEMPRALRIAVLREARRVCHPEGRVLAVEPTRTATRWSALWRSAWLFLWIPGNPEAATIRDLIGSGLANEMAEAGLSVLERHVSTPDWFEGLVAAPRAG
ncbi:MAG: methyltransferase domain-containing protein [Deltaproteobacteria bacterium]|nr:methyltransferase domain-containing protein [Deltaproteobacteria bacterium]